jgi:PEP-CTERM putative exosortase interaction domain
MKKASLIAAVAVSFATFAQAQTLLVGWNFNNNTAGADGALGKFETTGEFEVYSEEFKRLTVASHGLSAATATVEFSGLIGEMGGTANNNWGTFGGSTINAFEGDASGGALAIVGSGNNGSSVVFTFSTVGFESIALSYASRNTGTGFNLHTWEWSTDGENWNEWTSVSGINTSFQAFTLPEISGLDNLEIAYVRVSVSGATTTNGNTRIDNLQIVSVPEPTTVGLMGLGATALIFSLRRRRSM